MFSSSRSSLHLPPMILFFPFTPYSILTVVLLYTVWLLRTWFGASPVNKLVSLTWLLWAPRSFRRFPLRYITFLLTHWPSSYRHWCQLNTYVKIRTLRPDSKILETADGCPIHVTRRQKAVPVGVPRHFQTNKKRYEATEELPDSTTTALSNPRLCTIQSLVQIIIMCGGRRMTKPALADRITAHVTTLCLYAGRNDSRALNLTHRR